MKLEGNVGHHRQRRRPGDVDARRGGAGRCEGRELPRRGRRCQRRSDGDLAARWCCPTPRSGRCSSTSSAGSRGATWWPRACWARSSAVEATVPIVVRLDGTNAEEGRADPRRCGAPADRGGRHDAGGRRTSRRLRATGRPHERPGRRGHELVVQGITGHEGTFHTLRNRAYGTDVVAGVTPGKARPGRRGHPGLRHRGGRRARTGREHAMIFVPPRFAAEAILEAADAGVALAVCITEGIPVQGHGARAQLPRRDGRRRWSGRTAPGVISAGRRERRHHPGRDLHAGPRRDWCRGPGTLVYQIVHELTQRGLGQSTCIGMGGDPVARHRVHRVARAVRGRTRTPT